VAKKPTEIHGLILKSEFEDKELYDQIRTLQLSLINTYNLLKFLEILEIKIKKSYYYTIKNKKCGLIGFVGRDLHTNSIFFLVKDFGRIKWMILEGFDLTEEDFNNVGVMAKCKTIHDFILFMAQQSGYEFSNHVKSS
jgi:hypothetical protein